MSARRGQKLSLGEVVDFVNTASSSERATLLALLGALGSATQPNKGKQGQKKKARPAKAPWAHLPECSALAEYIKGQPKGFRLRDDPFAIELANRKHQAVEDWLNQPDNAKHRTKWRREKGRGRGRGGNAEQLALPGPDSEVKGEPTPDPLDPLPPLSDHPLVETEVTGSGSSTPAVKRSFGQMSSSGSSITGSGGDGVSSA